ncbi:MAG: hypothetical protein ACHRHE_12685 [Tepidisphaerales bacterium]
MSAFSSPPSLRAVVRKMRSPQTTGEDQPRPGTSTDQATFWVVDQVVGRPAASETPREPGPRN